MDVEELRRSQRRYRAGRGRGHGDGSDEDDDDLGSSTPGADSSDKNIHSMLGTFIAGAGLANLSFHTLT